MSIYPELSPSPAYFSYLPKEPRPILLIGAGGIVRDAHLPAYKKAGFPVWGIVNRTESRARELAEQFGIQHVYQSLQQAVSEAPINTVFDLALMPEQYVETLMALPDNSAVLIQKPLGHNLEQAKELLEICRRKNLTAAVNTQLRFAPYIEKARKLMATGQLGKIFDFEIKISVNTPWELFPHVFGLDRLEINMHSVHYLDLARSIFGEPDSISAVTVHHPLKTEIATTRSTQILRYRSRDLRVIIDTNHDNSFGTKYQDSYIQIQGTSGSIRIKMGLLLNYPIGEDDSFEIFLNDEKSLDWQTLQLEGSWFPDAFIGSMGSLQSYLDGTVGELPTSVEDVIHTMELVESAYTSNDSEGINLKAEEKR